MAANAASPFVDVLSFTREAPEPPLQPVPEIGRSQTASPFLSLYELDDGETDDPQSEALVATLAEFDDEEFDEALFEMLAEASALVDDRYSYEAADPERRQIDGARLLDAHFAPLIGETEAFLERLSGHLAQNGHLGPSAADIDGFVEEYVPAGMLSPSFENFFGKWAKKIGNVAKKAASLALPGGLILGKLKPLIKPLIRKVIKTAIGRLPPKYQPLAKMLAKRLPMLGEVNGRDDMEGLEPSDSADASSGISGIQQEFNQQIAYLLHAGDTVEEELGVARYGVGAGARADNAIPELDQARAQFVANLSQLTEAENLAPHVERFIPAILPALKLGIKIVGRQRVVKFLAGLLAKLIQKFVGPQNAPALSQAMVDVGLRLISLEATDQDESEAAFNALAATVEDSVRRVSALPEYVLDDDELFEAAALEAVEDAAATNLPPVLPEKVYRARPDLRPAGRIKGTWIVMPLRGCKRYKKFSRVRKATITPQMAEAVKSYGDTPLSEILQDQYELQPGADVEAQIHLYESLPGTLVSDISRLETATPGLGSVEPAAYSQMHPLTPEAAGLLLGEPGLGRSVAPQFLAENRTTDEAQRFYYLEIPGVRRVTHPGGAQRAAARRSGRTRLVFDFPQGEVRVLLYLSEVRAQAVAGQLRQGVSAATLRLFRRILEVRVRRALEGSSPGALKIIHGAVLPKPGKGPVLDRLPGVVRKWLAGRLTAWLVKGIAGSLKQHSQAFIEAAQKPADGVTLVLTLRNMPGLSEMREALKGKPLPLAALAGLGGAPDLHVTVRAGHA